MQTRERARPAVPPTTAPPASPPLEPPTPPVPAAPAPPAAGGTVRAAPPSDQRRLSRLRRLLLLPIALVALAAASFFGYRYWYEDTHFVSTDNAQVTGALVQFGSLNAGRVVNVGVDVGSRVAANQEVAVVAMPSTVATSGDGASKLGFTGGNEDRVSVRAPFDGIVVARMSNPGDTVQAGQAMLAIVDPSRLWIQALIEETKIRRVRVGQHVDVRLDQLDRTLSGRVQAITPAAAATFSLVPAQNTTGNFNKVTQLVPVKIALDYGDELLLVGTSVEVKIYVSDE